MRWLAIVIGLGIMIGASAGCSGTTAVDSSPTSLTPEEQRRMDEAQKKAEDEERAQRKSGG